MRHRQRYRYLPRRSRGARGLALAILTDPCLVILAIAAGIAIFALHTNVEGSP